MSDIQTKLDYSDAIADWFLELAESDIRRGALEEGLNGLFVAAAILYRHNRSLSSVRLESNLLCIADSLEKQSGQRRIAPRKPAQKEVCLHVMNEAIPAGGHMAMARRWMTNDRSGRIHSVALLSQQSKHVPIPNALIQAVNAAGGTIYTADPNASFLNRAVWLRNLSDDVASHVVLHVNTTDVISAVAFGTNEGPPVLAVNHSAHTFWAGASVPDLVLNCRGSELETLWTNKYRGVARSATVPIPMVEPSPATAGIGPRANASAKPGRHWGSRKTRRSSSPSEPFSSTCRLTLLISSRCMRASWRSCLIRHLIAVGFQPDSRWSSAARRLGSRIRVLGPVPQSQLAIVHDAADIYAEGFPFGTTTALLEAGLKGIPVVLSPAQCPPPYGSDGVALDDTVERSRTVDEVQESGHSIEHDA